MGTPAKSRPAALPPLDDEDAKNSPAPDLPPLDEELRPPATAELSLESAGEGTGSDVGNADGNGTGAASSPYAALGFNEICREIFDFHDQVTDLYRNLVGKAEIPEARELLESLLELEQHEAMRLVRQTGRMDDL